jgi:hypothetical protein
MSIGQIVAVPWTLGGAALRGGADPAAAGVFSNSGLSLERPGIGNAKRVDPLLIGRVYPGG